MPRLHYVSALFIVVGLLVHPAAWAQTSFFDRVGSLFDDVARGFSFLGEKAQDLIGPGLGFGEGDAGGFTASREFNENYPAPQGALVSIANEFGQIRITTWDNPVIQVLAKMRVRAESMKLASELVERIVIQAHTRENQIELRTVLPDTRGMPGKPAIEVNYEVQIPKDAGVIARNDFGDTTALGIGGTVAIDARYGAVELRQIPGHVSVRSRGEFAVTAEGLGQGGIFELHGARAVLSKISGKLEVSNFQGAIELHELAEEADVEAVSESGLISLYLSEHAKPDLAAAALFGEIKSEMPLSRSVQGHFSMARSPSIESKQRISLRATFGDIAIQYERPAPLVAADIRETQPFKEVVTREESVAETDQLVVEVVPGDVRVTGIDENVVRISATKLVRVQAQSNVRAALQALNIAVAKAQGTLTIKSAVTDNMAALGCVSHRVDITIECPRTVPVSISAQDGMTAINDTGGNTTVRQASGSIVVEHAKGVLDLVNEKGDVQVTNCAGPLTATTSFGDLKLNTIYGRMQTACSHGRTIIETPRAEILARSTDGDIRVLSMDVVAGNYDIAAVNGNISLLIPPATDATIAVTAENGTVKSSLRLPGSVDANLQEFVKVNTGPFRVTLKTQNGDIVIN